MITTRLNAKAQKRTRRNVLENFSRLLSGEKLIELMCCVRCQNEEGKANKSGVTLSVFDDGGYIRSVGTEDRLVGVGRADVEE